MSNLSYDLQFIYTISFPQRIFISYFGMFQNTCLFYMIICFFLIYISRERDRSERAEQY